MFIGLMQINIKKNHPDAVIPSYAKEGDAGMDLTAVSKEGGSNYIEYDTGLALEIPPGFVGLIFPRSSVYKTGQVLSNCVGVIDSGYRGNVKVKFYTEYTTVAGQSYVKGEVYKVGDRVAQLIILPYPQVLFKEVNELSSTERGEGGFGSTGN